MMRRLSGLLAFVLTYTDFVIDIMTAAVGVVLIVLNVLDIVWGYCCVVLVLPPFKL